MTTCLSELAGSTDDETQWQHLNYQVLLNLRSDSPAVCACVIDVVRAFVDREEDASPDRMILRIISLLGPNLQWHAYFRFKRSWTNYSTSNVLSRENFLS